MNISFTVFLNGLIFILPAYFANTVPVYINGIGRLDGGLNFFDGKPLLGANKSIGGLISATLAGGLLGISTFFFFNEVMGLYPVWIGFVQGFGAMLGDAVGSFIKRRFKFKPGQAFPVMDQIGFVVFAYLLVYPIEPIPLEWPLLILPATMILHLFANTIAYKMGWKDVWW